MPRRPLKKEPDSLKVPLMDTAQNETKSGSSSQSINTWAARNRARGASPSSPTRTPPSTRDEELGDVASDAADSVSIASRVEAKERESKDYGGERVSRNRSGVGTDRETALISTSRSFRRNVPASVLNEATMDAESLDYALTENEITRREMEARDFNYEKRIDVFRWLLTFAVAVVTALCAVFITFVSGKIEDEMAKLSQKVINAEKSGSVEKDSFFVSYMSISMTCALIASAIVVYIEPVAAGSGIPEIKAMLNGITVKKAMRLKTLVLKSIGIIFSQAGNLPIGKAGTMIHCGAICGAGLSQGKSTTLGFDTSFSKFKQFRNDREKRDFIACGAAAGIAAAFGSPLGGIMFCLEEGSSYWSPSLTWRTIFSAMISAFVADIFMAGIRTGSPWGSLTNPGILAFGNVTGDENFYRIWELPFFLFLGLIGGLLGAAFNGINSFLHGVRRRYLTARRLKILEVLLISISFSTVSFWLPRVFYPALCRERNREGCPGDTSAVEEFMIQFYCPDGQYDELATLYMNSPERAIKYLFHTPSAQPLSSDCNFTPEALILFVVPYLLLACWTFSAFIPAGIFIPSILAGAATGRLYGHVVAWILERVLKISSKHATHGMYSLIGAAAMLSGNLRFIISITVIFIETTGDAQYALPVFLTALTARWCANMINMGIFDMTIRIRHLPFLKWRPPGWYNKLTASDVMSASLVTFDELETAGNILDVLRSNGHHAFPVVRRLSSPRTSAKKLREDKNLIVVGLVMRKHLCAVLHRDVREKVLFRSSSRPILSRDRSGISMGSPLPSDRGNLTLEDIEGKYPRFTKAQDITLSPEERKLNVDIRPIYDPTPHIVRPIASLTHVYSIFRHLGLRHCIVARTSGRPVGIITRQDLTEDHARQCLARVAGRSQFSLEDYDPAPPSPFI